MTPVFIAGCGFVADLYMKSFAVFPDVTIALAYDRNRARAVAFSEHWNVPIADSMDEFLGAIPSGSLVLNLTNPDAHFDVSKRALEAGCHVYSEKPLAMQMAHARVLNDIAMEHNLLLAAAPSTILAKAGQTLLQAVRQDVVGQVRLAYAELDDGFIAQAPYQSWVSESGAPWPADDEFRVGCTIEHAGYYLSWLIACFGSVRTVMAACANTMRDVLPQGSAPDFSVAVLFFESGEVVRLTCSIVAPHNHTLQIIGDKGVLRVKNAWDTEASVKFHKRLSIRRKLFEHPLGKRVRPELSTAPKVARTGAATINFALGPVEMLSALRENRPCRISADFTLHVNEVTLAIQNANAINGIQVMETSCAPMELLPWPE